MTDTVEKQLIAKAARVQTARQRYIYAAAECARMAEIRRSALAELNAAQRSFDTAVAAVRNAAPQDSAWQQEMPRA